MSFCLKDKTCIIFRSLGYGSLLLTVKNDSLFTLALHLATDHFVAGYMKLI